MIQLARTHLRSPLYRLKSSSADASSTSSAPHLPATNSRPLAEASRRPPAAPRPPALRSPPTLPLARAPSRPRPSPLPPRGRRLQRRWRRPERLASPRGSRAQRAWRCARAAKIQTRLGICKHPPPSRPPALRDGALGADPGAVSGRGCSTVIRPLFDQYVTIAPRQAGRPAGSGPPAPSRSRRSSTARPPARRRGAHPFARSTRT